MKHLKLFESFNPFKTKQELEEFLVDLTDDGFTLWSAFSDAIYLKRKIVNSLPINNYKYPKYSYDSNLTHKENDEKLSIHMNGENVHGGRWVIASIGIDKNGDFEGLQWGNVWRRKDYAHIPQEQNKIYHDAFNACVNILNYIDDRYINLKIHSTPAIGEGYYEATQVIKISFHDTITEKTPIKE